MNGGRRGPPPTLDGCLAEFGKIILGVFIFGMVMAAIVGAWQLVFNQPSKVCVKWGDFQVIEEFKDGYNTYDKLVTKKVCTKFEEKKP